MFSILFWFFKPVKNDCRLNNSETIIIGDVVNQNVIDNKFILVSIMNQFYGSIIIQTSLNYRIMHVSCTFQIVFAATVGMEVATGNSIFRKMDLQGIEEAGGVCLAAITSAAVFAWFSSNRNRVGQIFTGSCNTFIDSIIDQVIDGLFYDTDISD